MLKPSLRRAQRGVTLIEILVVVAIIAILTVLAVPNFSAQLRNAQVRTAAEQLQNDLRQAQAQAIAQNRQVEFVLSSTMATAASPTPAAAATATASYWYAATIPLFTGDPVVQVAAGSTGGAGTGEQAVTVTAPSANTLCFSPSGRLTGISSSATVTCSAPTIVAGTFQVRSTNSPASFQQLNVTVSAGGQVRLCNSNKSLASSPDGC
jgi:type IV fimbrial biogenesis protein FimT